MANSIKKPVGDKVPSGGNDSSDVKIVQTLLNKFVAAGQLGALAPLAVDGKAAPTIPYIREFQQRVAGFKSPDGRVDPLPGKTMTALLKEPASPADMMKVHLLALDNIAKGPPPGIKTDIWNAALNALISWSAAPELKRPTLLTLVDFRLSRKLERLWAVDLTSHKVLITTLVAHGGGPKNSAGKPIYPQGDIATRFEDGNRFSSLGAYITLHSYLSDLGHLNNKPAMKIIGLEKGVNGRAKERGVVFHGADYVKSGSVGNSWGCFATPPTINPSLVETIKGGSFVFAYHGTYKSSST